MFGIFDFPSTLPWQLILGRKRSFPRVWRLAGGFSEQCELCWFRQHRTVCSSNYKTLSEKHEAYKQYLKYSKYMYVQKLNSEVLQVPNIPNVNILNV